MPKRDNPVFQYFSCNETRKKFKCSECDKFYCGEYSENLMKHLNSVHKNIYNNLNNSRRLIKDPDHSSQNKIEKYMKQTNTKT